MVEIILRKDIQDYEARPLFGFTYRQVATGAAIAITAAGMGLGDLVVHRDQHAVADADHVRLRRDRLVGLGRIHDLKFEQWFAIWKADRDWPKVALFAAPTLSPHGDPRLRQGESRQEAQEGDQSGEGGGAGGRRRGRGIEKTEKTT